MAKATAKNNAKNGASAAPVGPWREGRPSFKAFYPELILLTIITVACVAFSVRLSCSGTRTASEAEVPKPLSSAVPSWTAQAFAQDRSLDDASLDPTAVEPVAAEADAAVEGEEPATLGVDVATVEAETTADVEATAAEGEAADAEKKGGSWKLYVVWVPCLLFLAVLWGWRAWVWICAIYGVKFEIRSDPDNPKATTVLVHRGIFNKKTDSLHIAQIKDMQTSQTLWQKYFQGGVGTIRLFTNDLTDGILEMKNMEEPSRVFNSLDELRRRYWALGGFGGFGGQTGGVEIDGVDALDNAAM